MQQWHQLQSAWYLQGTTHKPGPRGQKSVSRGHRHATVSTMASRLHSICKRYHAPANIKHKGVGAGMTKGMQGRMAGHMPPHALPYLFSRAHLAALQHMVPTPCTCTHTLPSIPHPPAASWACT